MHQVIFENYAIPGGLMLGTDSHTPNAGGLGMIAIGVGGADAAEVMAGLAWETTNPYLVGVRLTGKLRGWASAKDVVFEMLKRLTVKGGTGKIFEYFGSGARALSATQKATITNMGAELGATSSVFVFDQAMSSYLKNVGRAKDASLAESFSDILCQDEICRERPEEVFDEFFEIDLNTILPSHAGPDSPDRVTGVENFKSFLKKDELPEKVSAVLMGSCTNSSYSDLNSVAQILKQAMKQGLKPQIPFFLSPGSTRIYETIKRDGILDIILESGVVVLTSSCGPCIGQWDRKDVNKGETNCIFTTFNRNFKGRNDANPATKSFLTSPVMAATLALSGDAGFNPDTDNLVGSEGSEFKLVSPTTPALPDAGLEKIEDSFLSPSEDGRNIEIKIEPNSERLEFLVPFKKFNENDFMDLPVLVKTEGKTTTDHISPGGKWLRYRGHLTNISKNLLDGALNAFTGETGTGINILTNEKGVRLSELAEFYKRNTGGFVVVGDENYGEGSSREHAAMSPRFLGAKVVMARSFARIHEANLKKQGILPLIFQNRSDYERIEPYDRMSFIDLSKLKPGKSVKVRVKKKAGITDEIGFDHTLTNEQIEWFEAGSAMNIINRMK